MLVAILFLGLKVSWCVVEIRETRPSWVLSQETSCDVFGNDSLDKLDTFTQDVLSEANEFLTKHTRWSLSDEEREGFVNSVGGERSSTFGHILQKGAVSIIRQFLKRTSGTSFLDLGAGVGHLTLFGAILAKNVSFRGVELAVSRINVAKIALSYLDSVYPELNLYQRVHFEQGDMLDTNVQDVDAIFVSNLALGDDLQIRLAEKLLRECRPGTVRSSSSRRWRYFLAMILFFFYT
mmetsp:Transcript_4692/g.6650  ORF Transcript_4692/g.6650 Transcript_4692/m.6650 type:complete len:236 (+) Transcript_4692:107-814(+)